MAGRKPVVDALRWASEMVSNARSGLLISIGDVKTGAEAFRQTDLKLLSCELKYGKKQVEQVYSMNISLGGFLKEKI